MILITGRAYGGALVSFGPHLCDYGQLRMNGECVDMVRGRCPVGFYEANIDSVTYSAVSVRGYCMNTYTEVVMPDYLHPIYNGVLAKFGPILCGADQDIVAGKCVSRTQGRCPDGFYEMSIAHNTFASPSIDGNSCMNTYHIYSITDYFSPVYDGILVKFGPTLCGADMHYVDGECVAISQGDCPAGFFDIAVDDATLQKSVDGACMDGYQTYWLGTNCATWPVVADMCAILCDDGMLYTGRGACVAACADARAIRTSSGVTVPLYAARPSTPALNLDTPGGVCYGNLAPGMLPGAINIEYNGMIYHTSD